ncbi:hypothetical protein GW17_00054680, partial [Ensete ventricosum]
STARGHDRLRLAHRGDSRPWAQSLTARRPQREPAAGRLQGAAAHGQLSGKGSRHLRRGNGGAEGERGVRASFREKDDPAPINSKNFED